MWPWRNENWQAVLFKNGDNNSSSPRLWISNELFEKCVTQWLACSKRSGGGRTASLTGSCSLLSAAILPGVCERVRRYIPRLMLSRQDQLHSYSVPWGAFKLSGERSPPPKLVPLLLEEADRHSVGRILSASLLLSGKHPTRSTFSSSVVPWRRLKSAQQHSWEEESGSLTLRTQPMSGFLPGFPESCHQRCRSWATAWISPHFSVLMLSVLSPLNQLSCTQNLASYWLFTKYTFKHSLKENSHGGKWQELRLLH